MTMTVPLTALNTPSASDASDGASRSSTTKPVREAIEDDDDDHSDEGQVSSGRSSRSIAAGEVSRQGRLSRPRHRTVTNVVGGNRNLWHVGGPRP